MKQWFEQKKCDGAQRTDKTYWANIVLALCQCTLSIESTNRYIFSLIGR